MSRKILLIDDSAMLRRITANILRAQPGRYNVTAATRAVEGFAMACVGGIDLILMDYLIAGLADAQLCRSLLADARTAQVPMILMVGQGVRPPPLASLPLNVVDTISKPFAPEQLSGVVNTVLGFTRTGFTLGGLRASLHPELRADHDLGSEPAIFSKNYSETGATADSHPRNDSAATAATPRPVIVRDPPRIRGDTMTVSLRNVMRAVAEAGDSGVLSLWPEVGAPTEVTFDEGKIVAVSTRDATTYAAHAAEAVPAKVSPATLEEAIVEQRASGTPFLLTLGTCGLLSKSSAVALLHRFGQRQFARLWPQRARPPVRYDFRKLDALPQYTLRLEASRQPLDEWLLESTRHLRADDVAANLRHEGSVGTPFFQPDGVSVVRGLGLTEAERTFLSLTNGRTDLPTMAKALKTTQETVYLMLFRFRCLDVLSYRTAPAAFVMTPRTHLRRVLPLHR